MEDAATAEIARSQVWQWVHHGAKLAGGETITPELVRRLEGEELERIRAEVGDDDWFEREGRPQQSRDLFDEVVEADGMQRFFGSFKRHRPDTPRGPRAG